MPDTIRRPFISWVWSLLLTTTLIQHSVAEHKALEGHAKLGPRSLWSGERQLQLKIDDEIHHLKLLKQPLATQGKRPSKRNADVEVLETPDMSVTCLEECDGACISRCLRETADGYTYVNHNRALSVRSAKYQPFPSNELLQKIKEVLIEKHKDKRGQPRTRRSVGHAPHQLVFPNYLSNDTVMVKLRFMMDVAFLQRFIDFVEGNKLEDAKEEIEHFLILLLDRVTLQYARLNELGINITTTNNVSLRINFAFCLENVTYPPRNATDGTFYDIDAIVNNRKDGFLVTNVFAGENNIFSDVGGLVIDFSDYMYDLFEGLPQPFDLVHFLSGDKLAVDFYDTSSGQPVFTGRQPLLGIAYIGALCFDFNPLGFDSRFGFTAYDAPIISRIVAHELGHNFGAFHDMTPRCPADAYNIMTAAAPPLTADLTEYFKWSVCSAEEIAQYLSIFTSDRLATCFFTDRTTRENCLEDLCEDEGLLGLRYDVNDQCRLLYGKGSYLCADGDIDLEDGYVAFNNCVTKQRPDGSFEAIVRCAIDNSCEGATHEIQQIFDGTKCLSEDGSQGEKICFEGRCATYEEICEDDDISSNTSSDD